MTLISARRKIVHGWIHPWILEPINSKSVRQNDPINFSLKIAMPQDSVCDATGMIRCGQPKFKALRNRRLPSMMSCVKRRLLGIGPSYQNDSPRASSMEDGSHGMFLAQCGMIPVVIVTDKLLFSTCYYLHDG